MADDKMRVQAFEPGEQTPARQALWGSVLGAAQEQQERVLELWRSY
jgi:hypothetical protein